MNKKSLLTLISEAKADVVETVEDLTEDEEMKEMQVSLGPRVRASPASLCCVLEQDTLILA